MNHNHILNIFKFLSFFAIFFLGTIPTPAADIKTVEGEATWYDDGSLSRKECMRLALEQARVNALALNFGTIISQDIMQSDKIVNGREVNDFLALSTTEVRGEWISDIGEPQYIFSHDADENLIVTCRVKGKAKAVTNDEIPFQALILRNGERDINAETSFRDGDEMKLLFSAAADGYVNVFLEDESRTVYSLLPYPRDSKSEVKVRKDKNYIFFRASDSEFGPPEEIILTSADHREYNRIYVLFSPERFSRPVMEPTSVGLPAMSADNFSKWLVKLKRNDPRLGVRAINIMIDPK